MFETFGKMIFIFFRRTLLKHTSWENPARQAAQRLADSAGQGSPSCLFARWCRWPTIAAAVQCAGSCAAGLYLRTHMARVLGVLPGFDGRKSHSKQVIDGMSWLMEWAAICSRISIQTSCTHTRNCLQIIQLRYPAVSVGTMHSIVERIDIVLICDVG